jgi:hypothetical protein
MSFCDGAKMKVTAPAGGWWLAIGNSRPDAFAALLARVAAAAKDSGFECAGRECRGDLHALCRERIDVVPTYVGRTIKGRKVILCVYRGDVTLKCECYKPPKK